MSHRDNKIDDSKCRAEFAVLGRPATRRDFLKGAAALGGAIALGQVLAGCGGGEPGASPTPTGGLSPKKGGELRLGVLGGSTRDVVDPALAYNLPDLQRVSQLYDRLAVNDHDYALTNGLAEEIEAVDSEATVWRIRLRGDVVFHDGKPLTADDVIFTFQRILDPDFPNSAAPLIEDMDANRLKKLDELTVEIQLKRPNAILKDSLAEYHMGIVPEGFNPKAPVGTGAFKYKSFKPGDRSVFLANTDYWGEGPYVDSVTTVDFADAAALVNALLGSVVDGAAQVPAAQLETIKADPGLRTVTNKTGNSTVLFHRVDLKPFTDVRVRQAMRLVANREQMVDLALSGYGRLGNDMLCPFDPAYPSDLPQREQDIEKAKSLLKEAGQEDLAYELFSAEVGVGALECTQVFAEQAKAAGVSIRVKKVDMGVYYGDKYTTWPAGVDWWSTRNYLTWSRMNSVWDLTHFKDARYSSLVKEAFATPDEAKRNEIVRQCYMIDHDIGGYIVWAFTDSLDAHVEKLNGFTSDALSSFNGGHVNQVWFA